ncbi:MAG: hypothetical protein FWE98_03540 [Oscillospiraceae bacterium]|nr:hypothetical protein [Oscillospiraceae bacterium]
MGNTLIADISKMDRQALLGTFAQALPVLTNYESFRDMASDQRGHLEDMKKGDTWKDYKEELKSGNATERAQNGLADMMKTHPKEFFSGVGCLAAGVILFMALLQVSFLLALLLLVPGLVGGFIFFNRANKSIRKEAEGVLEATLPKLDEALAACEQSSALLSIPSAYRYSYALEQMSQLLQSFRANTWMECADRYEETMHRMRLEGLLEENNELMMINNFYQQQIDKNTRAAAIFSGLTFLNTL